MSSYVVVSLLLTSASGLSVPAGFDYATPAMQSNAISFMGAAPDSDCKDDNPDCAKWAKDDQCNKNPDYMKDTCKKSCNTCSSSSSTSSTSFSSSSSPSASSMLSTPTSSFSSS